MDLISFIYITGAVALSLIGDFLLKKAGGLRGVNFYSGLIVYAMSGIPAALAFKKVPFGIVFIVWESLMIIFGLAIGSGYFKETMTANKIIALALSLGAIFFAYK